MPNWNLSVAMTASGDLATMLRDAARDAKKLDTALKSTVTEVRSLGTVSRSTARDLGKLGTAARGAARDVDRLAAASRDAQRNLHLVSSGSAESHRNLTQLSSAAAANTRDMQRMSAQLRNTIRDLDRLAAAARTAGTRTGTVGDAGTRSMGRLQTAIGGVRSHMAGLLTLLAGGALIEGSAKLVENGNDLQNALHTFGATSNATSAQMARAGATANKLGNDLSLPKASAVEAADAMVELSKAGFRTDQAIDATRASLLLSAAAQTNAADSAKYLGDIMDQFGLSADKAGTAADVLAATANNASGGVTDIYYAMKYTGPVAHGLGISMQDAATGVGMLAKAGIIGQTAGTTLRGMLVNLSKPTKQMADGLETLGIKAYDSQGNFKGLRYVIEQLSTAQEHLSQKDFTAAAAKAFGKPALAGAVALAHQGTQSFDALGIAVRQQGAAAQIAAAQGKGLAGAMTQLKTQSKQTGLAIYQGLSPALEYVARGLTSGLANVTPKIEAWFRHLNNAAYLFGPDIEKRIHDTLSGVRSELSGLGGSFKGAGLEVAADALNILVNAGKATVEVLDNLVAAAKPVIKALGDIGHGGDGVSTSLNTVVYAFDGAAHAVGSLSGLLVPLGHLIGALVEDFSHLPGPVQTAILAMLLARRVTPIMSGLATTVGGRVTGAFRGLGAQMQVQRTLAASAGVSLSRYGAAFAVLQTRIPVIGRMADSFRTASTTGGRFSGTLRGMGEAARTGVQSSLSGLVNFLGGPWGVAIAAGTVVLGMWAAAQQRAAQAAAEHQAGVTSLTQAMRESNGAVNDAVREQAANLLQTTKVKNSNAGLVDVLGKAGYSLRDVTDAYLGQGTSLTDVAKKLQTMADAQSKAGLDAKRGSSEQKKALQQWEQYSNAAKTVEGLAGEADKAQKKAKDLSAAVKGTSGGTSAYDRLKAAVADLADNTADADSRTRALKQALDLLSGGTLDYQAAEARLNTAITSANDQLADGVNKADGWGKALLNANGSISTVTKNGQQLYQSLSDISDGAVGAAQAAFALAQSQGKSLPASIATATAEMSKSRTAAINLAKQYGLNAQDAAKLADSLGLIPGQVSILLETQGVDSVMAELLAVQAQLKQTPNAKKITVDALSADAQAKLKQLGFQISMIPGTRQFVLTVPTAGPKAAISSLQQYITGLQDHKTVNIDVITTNIERSVQQGKMTSQGGKNAIEGMRKADGGLVDFYADGGMRGGEQHVAQIAPGGTMRIWAEPETGGEAYIPLASSKRVRSKAIAMETVRRLGGDPSGITWHADGSVTDWRYDPMTGSLYSTSDAAQAAHKTRKVKKQTRGKNGKVTTTTTDVDYFDEAALEKKLATSAAATRRWNADLTKVAERAGSDVANALAAMGTDGIELTHKMATGTTKYVNQMSASLRGLAQTARASLTDYTRQLNGVTTVNAQFQANLARLAAEGFGALASQLAAQGDTAAQQLAADAVKNKGKASSANAAAKRANNALTSDQVAELVQIIGSVTSSKVGIHAVAAATGLGEDEIVTVAGKATAQIKSALGSRSVKFLSDLARAQKGLAYADGGIRPGIYGTTGGAVTFAEPSTGGEAYIPLGLNKRAAAQRVMTDVAHRFGLGLVAAGAQGGVTVIRQEGDTHINVSAVRTGASASDIGAQVGRSYRRAKRGGVNARG